jgi:hypothetical protein
MKDLRSLEAILKLCIKFVVLMKLLASRLCNIIGRMINDYFTL